MRKSIFAQSQDSVPPAPALMLKIALQRSYGPPKKDCRSSVPTSRDKSSNSPFTCCKKSSSSFASCANSLRSSNFLTLFSKGSTQDFKYFNSCNNLLEVSVSFQKDADVI